MTSISTQPDAASEAVAAARSRYAARRPRTAELHDRAQAFLPGGNTRSVLYHRPFPLRIARAWDANMADIDGHEYIDLLGEYSAGLYGHSNPLVIDAMIAALREGVSRGAHTRYEVDLAEAVCARFASVERVRFTNSGTEANLMALSAARSFTGRDRVLVFRGGYHGGLLSFAAGQSPVNAPYGVLLGEYNDAAGAQALISEHGDTLACVLVEPMLGSAGCLPGDREFLSVLREATSKIGALLIFDEVMTSRTGACGMQGRLAITPDLTTLGKYIGGGSSFGAFGGRADVMAQFDPSRPGALPHAGTFNNNVASMAAGHVGLTKVYPADVAERHTARGDELREELGRVFRAARAPFQATGIGSLLAVHATAAPLRAQRDLQQSDPRLQELLFLDLLEVGYYIAPRGYMALSLALSEEQLAGFVAAVQEFLGSRAAL
ncbi:MAG: aspartate aminotransferase family protein, partial [Streptosporangiaceae bacterium]